MPNSTPQRALAWMGLVKEAEERIPGSALGKVALRAMKSAHTGRLLGRLVGWSKLLREVIDHEGGLPALRGLMEYVLRVESGGVTEEEFRAMLKKISDSTGEDAMNLVDVLEARGQIKTLRTGIEMVLRARGLSLTAAQRERVEACEDPSVLEGWLARAATVARADLIFAS